MWRASSLLSWVLLAAAWPAGAQTPLPVQAQPLAAPLPVGGGLAAPEELGLSGDLWRGVTAGTWQSLLATQPARQASPTLRHPAASAIAVRATLPALPPATDSALLRARALAGYVNNATLGLFIGAQPAPHAAALDALRHTETMPQSEAELQLQADLAREDGDTSSLRDQKILAATGGDADAAEWLATYGYGNATQLARAYEADGKQRHAVLWTAIGKAGGDAARLKALDAFIAKVGAPGLLGARGALLLPTLRDLSPGGGPANAGMFALAAAQDDAARAEAWYDAAVPAVDARLWPLAVAMGLDAADAGDLAGWFTAAMDLPPARQLPLADILTLLEARGFVIPADLWRQAAGAPGAGAPGHSSAAQLAALQSAAENGRQGEAILRSAILGGTDLAQVPVPTVAAIIRAMAALGLNEIADRLTVEALLALLFPPREPAAA